MTPQDRLNYTTSMISTTCYLNSLVRNLLQCQGILDLGGIRGQVITAKESDIVEISEEPLFRRRTGTERPVVTSSRSE